MADNPAPRSAGPSLAVFGSDRGPGDPERAAIMSQAGRFFALRGARIVCLAENDTLPVPLLTAARAARGEVAIVADESARIPAALVGVPIERISDPAERAARLTDLSDVLVGLPGTIASAASLYNAWMRAVVALDRKPLVLVNRNRAFEFVRGFDVDIVSHSVRDHDRKVQFSDSVEDAWNKMLWMLGA